MIHPGLQSISHSIRQHGGTVFIPDEYEDDSEEEVVQSDESDESNLLNKLNELLELKDDNAIKLDELVFFNNQNLFNKLKKEIEEKIKILEKEKERAAIQIQTMYRSYTTKKIRELETKIKRIEDVAKTKINELGLEELKSLQDIINDLLKYISDTKKQNGGNTMSGEKEDNKTMKLIIGIIGIVVVSTIIYLILNKSKSKKNRRRR